MFSFLADITDGTDATYTVVVLDEGSMGHPRQYTLRPRRLRYALVGGFLALVTALALLFAFTPIAEWIPGRNTDDMRDHARLNALMVDRLQDSLAVQQQYIEQLKRLMGGIGEAEFVPDTGEDVPAYPPALADLPVSDDWTDHEQPALPVERMPATMPAPVTPTSATRGYLSSLQLPVPPPADGYLTRGFNPRVSHFAVDIAIPIGTRVQSIGDGYVIFADWTNDGGETLLVQHADGYVSVYKHNQRLLKRVGDRVRAREAIAISGNSGEISTGPHIHFELWHEGLAQDPQPYFIE